MGRLTIADGKENWSRKVARLILLMYLRDYKEDIKRLGLKVYIRKILKYWMMARRSAPN